MLWLLVDPNNPKFKKLQKTWYKKLADTGFVDIERHGDKQTSHAARFADNYDPITTPAKEHYYRVASQMLYEYDFKDELERAAWELHCEGLSIRNIVKTLNNRGVVTAEGNPIYKKKIHESLKRLAKDMGLAWKLV